MELQNLEMNMWILIALVTFCGIVLSYEDIYDRPRTTGKGKKQYLTLVKIQLTF